MSASPRARDGPGSLTIHLGDPGMSALHRVGLAGLAMSLRALEHGAAGGLRGLGDWQVTDREVALSWRANGTALFKELLRQSFRLTDRGLIWFRALGEPLDHPGAAVVLHNAMLGTFLQHFQSRRKASKQRVSVSVEVDGEGHPFEYLPLTWYKHQEPRFDPARPFEVAGWLYPGGMVRHVQASTSTALREPPDRALALLFAPVGVIYFEIHRRAAGVGPQYCIVVPAVDDLLEYSDARELFLHQGVASLQAAGASEAAVRVLSELEAHGFLRQSGARGCEVVAFGTVPWSKQQKSRVQRFSVTNASPGHLTVYRLASHALPPQLVVRPADADTGEIRRWWAVPQAPDWVAQNVIAGEPWWRGFAILWQRVRAAAKRAQRSLAMYSEREGLDMMVTDQRAVPDGAEARLIRACHEAWRRRAGALGERARESGLDFRRLYNREYERTRIGFARCKNAAMLRQTLTDFWARAGSLPDLQEGWPELLPLLGQRWQDARDLALLALASYRPRTPEEKEVLTVDEPGMDGGESK